MVIETDWYVVTGGPSSGKTKTIEALSLLGYAVVTEAARGLIDEERSKGLSAEEVRSNESEFQRIVLQMKIDVEDRIPADRLTFFERGIPDTIAYYQICGVSVDSVIEASMKRKYKGVFLLAQMPFENDYARTEDEGHAYELSRLLRLSYSNLGYDVIAVPAIKPISERVKFILSRVQR